MCWSITLYYCILLALPVWCTIIARWHMQHRRRTTTVMMECHLKRTVSAIKQKHILLIGKLVVGRKAFAWRTTRDHFPSAGAALNIIETRTLILCVCVCVDSVHRYRQASSTVKADMIASPVKWYTQLVYIACILSSMERWVSKRTSERAYARMNFHYLSVWNANDYGVDSDMARGSLCGGDDAWVERHCAIIAASFCPKHQRATHHMSCKEMFLQQTSNRIRSAA